MKTPRDLSGEQLARLLGQTTRQKGSHLRLTTLDPSEHHITIPNHDPLKVGTLNSILSDISEHLKISKQELVSRLF